MDDTRHKAYGVKSCWIVFIMITIWPTLWLVRHLFTSTDASFYHHLFFFFFWVFFSALFHFGAFHLRRRWIFSDFTRQCHWNESILSTIPLHLFCAYFKVHNSPRIIQKIKHEQWAMNIEHSESMWIVNNICCCCRCFQFFFVCSFNNMQRLTLQSEFFFWLMDFTEE